MGNFVNFNLSVLEPFKFLHSHRAIGHEICVNSEKADNPIISLNFYSQLIIILSRMKGELNKGGLIRGGATAIPRSESLAWILHSERENQLEKIWRERMDLDWQACHRGRWQRLDSPSIQGQIRGLHHDSISSLGFLVCTSVNEIGNWKVLGVTRDGDEAISFLFNSPLVSKWAGERQTIGELRLVMTIMHYLLLKGVANTATRGLGNYRKLRQQTGS